MNTHQNLEEKDKLDLIKSVKFQLDKIFSLEYSEGEDEDLLYSFKLLIFDDAVYETVCPFLKLGVLRENNIINHMNIREKREKIPDVMAIYIVYPTEENMRLIINDLTRLNFENFYINFLDKPDEKLLQNFFSDILGTDRYNRIYRISVHPIAFSIFHNKVFSLDIKNPYKLLNSPNVKEEEVNNYFEKSAKGLFNVLFSMKTIPLVKYRNGWFGTSIVNQLQEYFNEAFDKFPEIKEEFPKKNSTLLLFMDRENDLPIMLHHSASYGAMINDIFGLSRTKIVRSNDKLNKFEIDPISDYIWSENLATDFPTALEKIVKDFKSLNDQTSFLDNTNKEEISEISQKLNQTLDKVQELIEKKKILENHFYYAESLKDEVKKRKLDEIFDFEFEIMSNRAPTNEIKKKFQKITSTSNYSKENLSAVKYDILRACLIYYLVNKDLKEGEIQDIQKILVNNFGVKTSSLEFLKQKRAFDEGLKGGSLDKSENRGLLGNLRSKSLNIFSSFQNLMTVKQPSLSADLIDSLTANKEVGNFINYNFLKKGSEKVQINQNFSQVFVFFVGGGCLAEYEYLDQLFTKNNKNIIYGCDYLYSPKEFVETLEQLNNNS